VPRRKPAPLLVLALLFALLSLATGCEDLLQPPTAEPPPEGALVVSFIDVGQGDSILIQSAGENYLIDAGKPEAGPEVVDFLRSRGVETLDGLVATHPDADHIGGLPDVLDAVDVETVYPSGDLKGTATENAFLQAVQDEGSDVKTPRAGTRMYWGDAVVDVLSPPPGELSSESNDNSIATLLTFGGARILLTGDAEEPAEEDMANGPHTGPVTVLKVGHHGSNTSTSPRFLNRFPPRIAVIQVGENSYGHPTPETLDRLRRAGARVFRNDEDGDIIVTIRNGKVEVATTRGAP
jgi:beta-lactamase superfamily II metal-dependent hydrolase